MLFMTVSLYSLHF